MRASRYGEPGRRDANAVITPEQWQQKLDERRYWRDMPDDEKGELLYQLLNFAAAVGNFPPKRGMFPGFPRRPRSK